MKASKLIENLTMLIEENDDLEIFLRNNDNEYGPEDYTCHASLSQQRFTYKGGQGGATPDEYRCFIIEAEDGEDE